jgi:hypothetical protein
MADDNEFAMPRPSPELRRLDFLVGSWRSEGTLEPGAMGAAGTLSGTETFAWLPGGFFLTRCWHGTYDAGGTTVLDAGYEFFDFDPVAGTFRSHFFCSLGPYDATNSKYHGDFEGSALVLVGPARVTRLPDGRDRIRYRGEVPDGKGGWTPWLRGLLTRTPAPAADAAGGAPR